SASIPGIVPPVAIEVEANGKKFQELHVDGSVSAPFFVAPESVLAGTSSVRLPTKDIYVVANARLQPQFEMAFPQTTALLGRSIGLALQTGIRAEILLVGAVAQRQGITLRIAHIDPAFSHPSRGSFDPDYMKALFEVANEKAKKGPAFENMPIGAPTQRTAVLAAHTRRLVRNEPVRPDFHGLLKTPDARFAHGDDALLGRGVRFRHVEIATRPGRDHVGDIVGVAPAAKQMVGARERYEAL